jgi:ABC-type xylose transport system substrate-binding protein
VNDATGTLIVGVSWNNYNEERWAKSDEPAIKAALEGRGHLHLADAGPRPSSSSPTSRT